MAQQWCMQCGELNRLEPAIGLDEDGEPACSMHAVKRNDVEVSTSKAKLDAIRRPAPGAQRPIAQPVKEKPMDPVRICKCGCGTEVPASNRFSYISGHRARKPHGHAKLGRPKKAAIATAELGMKAPIADSSSMVDLGKLKCDLLAKLAAIELIEKTLRES